MKYKFKDIIVYQDIESKEIYLAVSSDRGFSGSGVCREDAFVTGSRKLRYTISASSVSYGVYYENPEDNGKWQRFSRDSVAEKLLGVSFDENQEFTLDELKALEDALNTAQQHAYRRAFTVEEAGKGDFDCMKKGDLLFAQQSRSVWELAEQDGNYRVLTDGADGTKTLIDNNKNSFRFTTDELPQLAPAILREGRDNPHGVFPNRSFYLDAAEYPMFTAEAYKRLLAKKKEHENGEPSNDGE